LEKWRDVLALLVILGLVAASLGAIFFLQRGIDVQVFTPENRIVARNIGATGEVHFSGGERVYSPFAGIIAEVLVKKGELVEKGDPLFIYDTEEWERELMQLKLRFQQLKEEESFRENQIRRELADLEARKMDWLLREEELHYSQDIRKWEMECLIQDLERELDQERKDLADLEDFYHSEYVTWREVQKARDQVTNLEHELKRARLDQKQVLEVEFPLQEKILNREGLRISNKIEETRKKLEVFLEKKGLNSAHQEMELIQGSIEQLELRLANKEVMAPEEGLVNSLMLEQGQRVNQGLLALEINDPAAIEIVLKVNSRDFHRLEKGQEVEVFLEDIHPPLSGKIEWIAPWAEEQLVETGVVLTDRRDLLRPGMVVEAQINLTGRRLLILPPQAVFERELQDTRMIIREGEDTAYYVFLVDKDSREVYPSRVRIGQETQDYIEIVSGLSASSNVVIGDTEALNRLEGYLTEWEQRLIEEIRVNFTDNN